MIYQILEAPADSAVGFCPYGGAFQAWRCKDHEIILAGPAETGKTRSILEKLDALAWKYNGARLAIVRKTYKSAVASVIQTFEKKVLGAWDEQTQRFDANKTPVKKYGGERPEWYDYPNKSRIIVGGLDNAEKFLSSEYDVIYVNQAEEVSLHDWETLATRCTGRAGNMPYAQLLGDANPGPPTHWMLGRRSEGVLTFFESRHEDNPTLFNPDTGEITEQGKRSMAVLDALTGVRKQRLRYGRWVQAEGVVYEEWDRTVNLIPRFDIPPSWRRVRAVDFGYTNPFVCQWWAIDNDSRMYLYREIYMTRRTVKVHVDTIKRIEAGVPLSLWSEMDDAQKNTAWQKNRERIEMSVCDHDAEDTATLYENGLEEIVPAQKEIEVGIQKVKERLKKAGDGKARLFVLEDSLVELDEALHEAHQPTCTEQEFDVYEWPQGKDGKSMKEVPVDMYNHGLDALRYTAMYVDAGAGMEFA